MLRVLFLICLLIPQLLIAQNEAEGGKHLSRRGFLRGLIAGAGVAATTSPGALIASTGRRGSLVLPEALRRKIVAARMQTITQANPQAGVHVPGLKGYVRYLKRLMGDYSSHPEIQAKLSTLAQNGERALETYHQVQEASLHYKAAQKALAQTQQASQASAVSNTSAKTTRAGLSPAQKKALIKKLRSLPADMKIITIRALLGPDLLRKMAWQAKFENMVLNYEEVHLIEDYRELIKQSLLDRPEGPLSAALAPRFLEEADHVLESYYRAKPQAGSCRALL